MMLLPTFTIKLGQPIFPSQVVIGKFDGKNPSLGCVTTGGKILIHSPHEKNRQNDNQLPTIRYLNFNRKITSLACGLVGDNCDAIYIGSENNLTAYNVERNSEIFFKEVSDGANAVAIGSITSRGKPLAIIGGNCSILGFDDEGNEAFWTVTADNVSALTFCDFDNDGQLELIVGSDDYEIRVFKNVEVIHEISEADKVSMLCPIIKDKFGYGLVNGTVGVYKGGKRLWRVKTKTVPTSIVACDMSNDGNVQFISGWMNGSFNIRNSDHGELLYRGTADSSIAAVLWYEYKMHGKPQLIVCSTSGEIIGYEQADHETIAISNTVKGITELNQNDNSKNNKSEDTKALIELQAKKLEYLTQLKQIEREMFALKNGTSATPTNSTLTNLPLNTSIKYELSPDLKNGCLNITASATTDVLIVSLIIIDLDGTLLDGTEVISYSPNSPNRSIIFPLKLTRYQIGNVKIQAHVAVRSALDQLHVMEANLTIPKFSCFRLVDEDECNIVLSNIPESRTRGQVTIQINETLNSFSKYITSAFVLSTTYQLSFDKIKIQFLSVCGPMSPNSLAAIKDEELHAITSSTDALKSMKNVNILDTKSGGQNRPLHIIANELDQNSNNSNGLRIKIRTDCMDLASELVQDIARYFKITELQSEADFPEELQEFEEVLEQVAQHNETRLKLSADMADNSQRIKALVVRAEDSRIMNEMDSMRKAYTNLFSLNTQLLNEHTLRTKIQENLLEALRSVNLMIQRAASLRVGNAKMDVIAECRKAIKNNNFSSLQRIIRYGSDRQVYER